MRQVTLIAGCGLTLAMMACGDDSAPPTPEQVAAQVAEAPRAASPRADQRQPSPCEALTDVMVRAQLGLGPRVELESRDGGLTCTHRWPNPDHDPAAMQRELMERVRRGMQKGGTPGGILEGAMTGNRTHFEATYTRGPTSEDAEAARRLFERNLERLSQGVSQQVDTGRGEPGEVSFQMAFAPVEGVGDQAAWSARNRKLGVLTGARYFWINVYTGEDADANFEAAKKLAQAILSS